MLKAIGPNRAVFAVSGICDSYVAPPLTKAELRFIREIVRQAALLEQAELVDNGAGPYVLDVEAKE